METQSYLLRGLLNYQIKELDHSKEKTSEKYLREKKWDLSIQGEIIKKGLYYCIIEAKHLKIKSKIIKEEK